MIHFTTLSSMQQSSTEGLPAAICQDVCLQREAQFSEGARKPLLYLWGGGVFQAQLQDIDAAETMTVL